MRRLIFSIMIILLAASCVKEESISILNIPKEIIFASRAEEATINLFTTSAWRAESSEPWLNISPASGGAGENVVKISAKANDEYDKRNAKITIMSDNIVQTILVGQKENLAIILNTNELFVGSEGGEIIIPFSTNEEYICSVDDNCKDWISITETKTLYNYNLKLNVEQNTGYDSRQGSIRIISTNNEQVVIIKQSQKDEMILMTTEYEIGSDGGEIRVPIQSNIDYKCEVQSSGKDWITLTNTKTKGLEECYIILNVNANENYDGRIGQVKVFGADKESIITISQSQFDEIIVSTTSFEIGSSGGQLSIPVRANVEYKSSILSGKEWLSISNIVTKGLTSSSIVVNVLANDTLDKRTGQIKVSGAGKEVIITITQVYINDLSLEGTSNSYIVTCAGTYKFPTVQGNSVNSVGAVAKAEVLWESFGTSAPPEVGDLVSNVMYENNTITFDASSQKGNALIAAKDADGKILWSWHIWMTDQPKDHVYNNGAGTMMDRNLGAISAAQGHVGALGLLYQWGRKDPFLGSSSISVSVQARSTLFWPSPVRTNSVTGTIAYATEHPTTFITNNNENNFDWYYTGDETTDNTRWEETKTIYDPCPVGYRVPEGGETGIWSTAFDTSDFIKENTFDQINMGFDFGKSEANKSLTEESSCWYPVAGGLLYLDGTLRDVGNMGSCWACSPYDGSYIAQKYRWAGRLYFSVQYGCSVGPSDGYVRSSGYSVRCARE